MADVRYGFEADDASFFRSLERQERAAVRTAGHVAREWDRTEKSFRKAWTGTGNLGGTVLAGLTGAMAIAVSLMDDYAASSRSARAEVDRIKSAWSGIKQDIGTAIFGGGNASESANLLKESGKVIGKAYDVAADFISSGGSASLGLLGLLGLGGDGTSAEKRAGYDTARRLDLSRTSIEQEMVRTTTVLREATRAWATAIIESNPNDLNRRRAAAAFERDRTFEDIAGAIDPLDPTKTAPMKPDEAMARRAAAATKFETTMREISNDELDSWLDQIRLEDRALRGLVDYTLERQRQVRLSREAASITGGEMRSAALRARGEDAKADRLDAELGYRKRLLDIEEMSLLTEQERAMLRAENQGLLAAELAAIQDRGSIFAGGRGVDPGLGSVPGVTSGSLVPTARANPSALIQQTNAILKRIQEAVERGGNAAVLAD